MGPGLQPLYNPLIRTAADPGLHPEGRRRVAKISDKRIEI